MVHPVVIIGAGGFGRHAHDVIDAMNEVGADLEMLGFLDDGRPDEDLVAQRGTRVLGKTSMLADLHPDVGYVIGIGTGAVRREVDRWAASIGREAVTLVHPSVTFGRNVSLSPGVVICAHASIGTNIRIGRHTHLNFNTTVGHDAVLADYVSAYPGANIAGNVGLCEGVTVGTGAVIIQGVTVGEGTYIGAAAAVVSDLPAGVKALGVPARIRA